VLVVTRQLLLDLCDVIICVMTSHPRSLLVQRLVCQGHEMLMLYDILLLFNVCDCLDRGESI